MKKALNQWKYLSFVIMLTEFAKTLVTHEYIFISAKYCRVASTFSWEKSNFDYVLTICDGQECVGWCLIDNPRWSHYHNVCLWVSLQYCQTKAWFCSSLATGSTNFLLFMGLASLRLRWLSGPGSQSLSLSSLFQIMVWCQTTILWVIPSSCSPIWILMPHCQLQFRALNCSWCSSSIKDLNTEEEGSEEGPDCAILTPDLVTLSALSSRSSLMRPLRYFNQENIQILIRTMEPRAGKFCQLWSTRS